MAISDSRNPGESSVTILHVSDMQFGRHHRFGRLALGSPDESFDSLLVRLCDDLDGLVRSHGIKPDVIALTGDLAEWGMKKEFEDVLEFADGLCEHLGLGRDRVLVVPGNHDINRKKCESYFSDREGDGAQPEPPYWPKWKPYAEFFHTLYKDVQRYAFTQHEPFTLYELPELKVVFAGLNSTMRESHREADHYGWLGEQQLRWFREKLASFRNRGWLRIGLVHHNVLRRAADDENLRDADDLSRLLSDQLNLLLHGHTHLGRIEMLDELPVLSTGSAGVKQEQRPEEVPNQYQIIRVHRRGLWCGARQYTVQDKKWIADARVSKNGNDWWQERKIDFEGVHGTFPPPKVDTQREPDRGEAQDVVFRYGVGALLLEAIKPLKPLMIFPGRPSFLNQVMEVCAIRSEGRTIRIEHVPHRGPWGPYARVIESERGSYALGAVEGSMDDRRLRLWIQDVHEPFRLRTNQPAAISHLVVASQEPISESVLSGARARGVLIERLVDYQRVLDVEGCKADLLQRIESDPIYPRARYIEQRISAWNPALAGKQEVEGAADWIVSRMQEPEGAFLLVLGPAGVGKTFLLREVAYRLATTQQLVTPLLIDLRNLDFARDVVELVASSFVQRRLAFRQQAFERDLRQGRIALLFDGFDELALRVRSAAIGAHFERILSAAREQARVVVTSRTEHFLSHGQVEELMKATPASITALGGSFQTIARRHLVALRPFERDDVQRYLIKALGEEQGRARFERLRAVHDLVGLATNPRMLGFLVDIPEDKLAEAEKRKDAITSADLYRLVVEESWLKLEQERLSPPGAAPGPTVDALRDAATRLALHLWTNTARAVATTDLEAHVGGLLTRLCEGDLDRAAQTLRSRTLLTRSEEGRVSFIHQTVMEWLVACTLTDEIQRTGQSASLNAGRLNQFMIDLLRQLLGEERLAAWADAVLSTPKEARAAENARDVLKRLGREARQIADLRGQDLRGQDLGGQDLRGAILDGANLTGVRLVGRDLSGASLLGAQLAYLDLSDTNLTQADLGDADLTFARFHRSKMDGARLMNARTHGASFLGARGVPSQLLKELAAPVPWSAFAPSGCYAIAHSPTGYLFACGHEDGSVSLWESLPGRLLRVLVGHSGSVRSLAFSPDSGTLASGSDDTTVRLWSLESDREPQVLGGHSGSVRGVAFSPQGDAVFSASEDHTVRIWVLNSREEPGILRGHTGLVTSVAISPRGDVLASGSVDGTVRLWSAHPGKETRILSVQGSPIWSVAFSPDGSALAAASSDKTVSLWSAKRGKLLRTLIGHDEIVTSVAFNPQDGRTLASGSLDGSVRLWSVGSGKEQRILTGHVGPVWNVDFSPDGRTLASASSHDVARLWSVDQGKELRNLCSQPGPVWSVAFNPKSRMVASTSADGTVRLWSAERGRSLRDLGHSVTVWSIAFSPTGSLLASALEDHTVQISSVLQGRKVQTLAGHTGGVLSVAFTPDGKTVASASADKTIRLWDVAEGKEVQILTGHSDSVWSVAFSPDGSTLASASSDQSVRLWSREQGTEIWSVTSQLGTVHSVAFSPDGGMLASAADDQTVALHSLPEGRYIRILSGHAGPVWAVAFSPEGDLLASASSDQTVRLWSVSEGTELRVLRGHLGPVFCVAFSPDGRFLLTGGRDATTHLWEVSTGNCLAILYATTQGTVAYRPDGRYRIAGDVSGSFWHTIGLHRYEPGELDAFFPGLRVPDGDPLFRISTRV